MAQQEFGRRRPPPAGETTYTVNGGSGFTLPPIEPMKLVFGGGYCVLGYVLGILLFVTLLPQPRPEFLRFVYVPADTRTDLIQGSFEAKHPRILMPGEN